MSYSSAVIKATINVALAVAMSDKEGSTKIVDGCFKTNS
jgi:hypothetical protein